MSSSQNMQVPDIKYKTELCRTWIEQNFCPYMEKCRFAHGKTDLQDKIIFGKNYKQKDCKSFHTKGFCPYGPRCLFRHDERKLSDLNRPYYKYALENMFTNLFLEKNLKKRNFSEEEILNKNIDIPEMLKAASNYSNNIGNTNLNSTFNNRNLNNSSVCFSNKNSELENSQIYPSAGVNQKTNFYIPTLNVFKKIHHLDSFSFDSTDVDIEFENSDYNMIGNCIENNKGNMSNFANFNISPKNARNYLGLNSQNPIGKAPNFPSGFGTNVIGDHKKQVSISNNTNLNKNNINIFNVNCQKNFPNSNNNGNNGIISNCINKNNNKLFNAFSNNYINNPVNSNTSQDSNPLNSLNSNNIPKNINLIKQKNSNFNNNLNRNIQDENYNFDIPLNDKINSNKKNNLNINNDESFSNTENINPNIVKNNIIERGLYNKNPNSSKTLENNSNNDNFIHKNNYERPISEKRFLNHNYSDNYNKIFGFSNYTNPDLMCEGDSPVKHDFLSNDDSVLSTENSNLKDESVPNSFFNDFENFNTNHNTNILYNQNQEDINNYRLFGGSNDIIDKNKINKETIFENFSKIAKNNNLKNNQKMLSKKMNENLQHEYFPTEKSLQSVYSANNIDEFMNLNIDSNNSNKTSNTNQLRDINNDNKSNIMQNKEKENYNFFIANNSNNKNMYSIY